MNDWSKNYLAHHGIIGMKWGVRKYQNADGTLTEAGKERYGRKTLSDKVGEKRLGNRLLVTSKANDEFAVKAGLENSLKSLNMEMLNEQTKGILKDPVRVRKIGEGTILRRVAAIAGSHSVAAGAAVIAATNPGAIIVGSAAFVAAAALGYGWIYYHETTY